MLASEMEKELVGTGRICCMATHALTWEKGAFKDRVFLEIMDIPLVDADLAVGLISWCELTVCHSVILQRILADEDHEATELLPLAVLISGYCNRKSITYISLSELMPFPDIEPGIASLGLYAVSSAVAHLRKHLRIVIRKIEVKRSDTGRNGHADIIRKDFRQFTAKYGLPAA
jgi:hypothetical protein